MVSRKGGCTFFVWFEPKLWITFFDRNVLNFHLFKIICFITQSLISSIESSMSYFVNLQLLSYFYGCLKRPSATLYKYTLNFSINNGLVY